MAKTAYLFLTDDESETTLDAYANMRKSVAPPDGAYILFHHKSRNISGKMKEMDPFVFTYETLVHLNYIPMTMDIIPGSNHFPVLQFYRAYPDFEFYWVMEDDVRFTGEWKYLFEFFAAYDDDFISSHICGYHHEPEWAWWRALFHCGDLMPVNERIRSFNPIYRISGKALQFLHEALTDKWIGHHEVLLPTLLYRGGYKILDFGGHGDFVAESNYNRFYTSSTDDPKGSLNKGTMRFRPVWKDTGKELNKLYHPVKSTPPGANRL